MIPDAISRDQVTYAGRTFNVRNRHHRRLLRSNPISSRMLPHTARTPDSAVSAQAPHAVVCSADSQGSQISRAHTGPKRRQQGRERLQRPAAGVALNSRGQKRCRQCPRVARAPRPPTPSYAFLELLDSPLLQPSRKKHKTKSKSRDGQNSRPLSRFARFAFARPISPIDVTAALPSARPSTVRAVRLRG